MSDVLRVGVVGCGRHCRGHLAPAVSRIASANLAACADADIGAAQRMANELGIEATYESVEELIGSGDVDAVIVAVPHRHLKEVALSAIEAGKHVFIEKPMGLNAGEGREVVEAAGKENIVAMVGFCMRYSLSRMFIKSQLERGVVGEVQFVVAGKGGAPLEGWLAGPYEEGGGQLFFLGSHLTDQVVWLTGEDPEAVSGSVRWNEGGTDETSAYTVRFEKGVVATFSVSQASGVGYDFVDIFGSKGRIRGDWYGDVVSVQSQVLPEYTHPTVLNIPGDNLKEMCYRELDAFVGAILSGRSAPIPVGDGLRVLEILDAVVASSRKEKWIQV